MKNLHSVVVGVDGSAHSAEALRQAVVEARCRSTNLHVVYVYEPAKSSHAAAVATVVAGGMAWSSDAGTSVLRDARHRDEEERAEQRRHAEHWIDQFVRAQQLDMDGVELQRSAVGEEHPAAALVRLARDAELLVVGSRGLGGFAGVLLGSISQHCVRHATCPVLVVRRRQGGGQIKNETR